MSISATDGKPATAVAARVDQDALVVELRDGRTISAPIGWYPRLVHANEAERSNLRLIGGGSGIHWPDIEEDISVESVIAGRPSAESSTSLRRWLETRMLAT